MEEFKPSRKVYHELGQTAESDTEIILQDTKELLLDIIEQLKEQFESGEFGIVLGIDSSARVPALLLSKTLRHVSPVELRFVSTDRNLSDEETQLYLEKLSNHFSSDIFRGPLGDRKVLIVDDVIGDGKSLAPVCEALRNASLEYHVATLSALDIDYLTPNDVETDIMNGLKQKLGSNITIGHSDLAKIYGRQQMSGVKKGPGIHSVTLDSLDGRERSTIPDCGEGYIVRQDREVLAVTRERIAEIADEIAEELNWKQT